MSAKNLNKTLPTNVSVEDFLQTVDPQKSQDAAKLCEIMQRITGQPPVMWGPSIIGFGRYHYKYESGREGDAGLLGFSPRKTTLVVYLVDGVERYSDRLAKLGPCTHGKSCLYIKRLSDINMDVLEQMLRESCAYVAAHIDSPAGS